MKLKRLIVTLAAAVMFSGAAIGCTEADQVSSNISKQADNFNVTRKLNDYTMYVVEDISGSEVDKYHYEINFLPEWGFKATHHE